jgi:hypothetical protein
MLLAINCTVGRNAKCPKISPDMMEPFVKIIFKVATALKAQHCNETFEDYGNERNGSQMQRKCMRHGKSRQTRETVLFDGIKRITWSANSLAPPARPSDKPSVKN